MSEQPAKPSRCRIVEYVVPAGPTMGESRPMLLIEASGMTVSGDVFFKPGDAPGLAGYKFNVPTYVQSISYADFEKGDVVPGTWHWPARV